MQLHCTNDHTENTLKTFVLSVNQASFLCCSIARAIYGCQMLNDDHRNPPAIDPRLNGSECCNMSLQKEFRVQYLS